MRIALTLCTLLLFSACNKTPRQSAAPPALGSKDNPLVMAFVPSVEAQGVMESGDKLATLMEERSGLTIETLQATSYVGIVEAMGSGDVHVAWLPPLAYVFAHQRNGATPILKVVRHGSPTYRGQILVAADSPIGTVADLKGRKVAFPDQTSASGHLYPKTLMLEHGVDPEVDCTVMFAGSHDAALTALLKGSADAACTFDDARGNLLKAFPDVMEKTRVLEKTTDIPADCVALSSGMDAATVEKLTTALTSIASDEEGREVLMELYEIEGLAPARDSDYEPVRQMAAQLGLDVEKEVK
ncbi:MAG: phosphate/phosphite/phosphonate ABC transporter substrate-binding protein [bacterium]|nr:phosphate/phosphite/phosphonate ABC transporter substrate-binding protein [bacterium]